MRNKSTNISFEISTSGREDGTVEAVYVRLADGQVERTVELIEDILLVDLDEAGRTLGLEVLAPVPISRLIEVLDEADRPRFQRFLEGAMPRTFLNQA